MSEKTFWDSHEKSLDVGREMAYLPRHALHGDITAFVRRVVESKGSVTMLEAGCGSGRWNFHLATTFPGKLRAVGVDFSDLIYTAGRYARQGDAAGTYFCKADIGKLPFRDGSFDAVLCLGVIEHFNPPAPVLAELRRVLAPDGALYVETPRAFHADAHDHDAELEIDYTLPELVSTLKAHAWDVERAYTRGFHFRVFYVLNYARKRLGLGKPGGFFYRCLGRLQMALKPLSFLGDPVGLGFYNIVIAKRGRAT